MKKIFFGLGCFLIVNFSFAQQHESETPSESENQTKSTTSPFKFSGYIQAQFEYGEEEASLKVGEENTDMSRSFNRIGVRRGRLKLEYTENLISGVFQLDMTEKGVGIKDAYLAVKDPWVGTNSLRVGIFNRPFGHEISYSSSRRESPERSRMITTLFPDERDIGMMLTLQAPGESFLSLLKLELALIAGNGLKPEIDNRKDFIGHLTIADDVSSSMHLSGGISYYNGGVYQGTENVYSMTNVGFVLDDDVNNLGAYAKREYVGADVQLKIANAIGQTQIRAEYVAGKQPGIRTSSVSPNYSEAPAFDTYLRNFNGGYFTLVQALENTGLSFVAKYDFYDPNTKVSGNEIGLNGTDKGDIAYQTFGAGLFWEINENLRLTAYYDWIQNEKTRNLEGFASDKKDNVFTFRIQYKF